MRILIVEDNVDLLDSMKMILQNEFTVETATDGEDGLFLAMQNIYDVILLDVMLPEINGFEIL